MKQPHLDYLPLVVEECGEVIQAAMKLVRFGQHHTYLTGPHEGETNIFALTLEVADLLEVIDRMGLSEQTIKVGRTLKSKRLEMYGPENWRPGIESET